MTQHAQDTQHLIGTLLNEGVGRDAIHIAVAPAVAGRRLLPAQRVGLVNGKAVPAEGIAVLGVVDPYLDVVMPGERFFIFLLPNTITSLRHAWTHPQFADEGSVAPVSTKAEAERWLRGFAEEWRFDYDEMISVARDPDGGQDYIVAHGSDLHSASELGDDHALFWQNLAVLTGRIYDVEHQGKVSWSCTC